jgi:hypothetical protein
MECEHPIKNLKRLTKGIIRVKIFLKEFMTKFLNKKKLLTNVSS